MSRKKYKVVESMIHAWVLGNELQSAGKMSRDSLDLPNEKPYEPLTPLHPQELYWDSQFVRAS